MAARKQDKIVKDSGVAATLTIAINDTHKTQLQIAEEVGFESTNMVTMIKQGRSKLPIAKVRIIADCLEIDAKDLLIQCMEEYQPQEWAVIREILKV